MRIATVEVEKTVVETEDVDVSDCRRGCPHFTTYQLGPKCSHPDMPDGGPVLGNRHLISADFPIPARCPLPVKETDDAEGNG